MVQKIPKATDAKPPSRSPSTGAARRQQKAEEVRRLRLAVAALLVELREGAALPLEELAQRARLSLREVSRFESGKLGDVLAFARLGTALGHDPGVLLMLAQEAAGLHESDLTPSAPPETPLTLESMRIEIRRLLSQRRASDGSLIGRPQ